MSADTAVARAKPAVAVDNDVLIKASCYGLLAQFRAGRNVGVLGAARYVVPGRIDRQALNGSAETAREAALQFITDSVELEPTTAELEFAVTIERVAQGLGLELDAGESQLAAMVIFRDIGFLETGDKRAIRGLGVLLAEMPAIEALRGRVRCLEQIISACVEAAGERTVADAICSEPQVDKTLSICFRCFSPSPHKATLEPGGLESYIASLREAASAVLAG